MDVKGTAFLARRKFVVQKLGQQAWDDFVQRIKADIPALGGIVLATALIPAPDFLQFQERLTRELFNNDLTTYWAMGRESAEWSLASGPYKKALESHNLADFGTKMSSIWRSFYNEGAATLTYDPPLVRFTVSDLPISHPYFELVAAGFVQRALELATGKHHILYKRVSFTAKGYIYQFGPV